MELKWNRIASESEILEQNTNIKRTKTGSKQEAIIGQKRDKRGTKNEK